MCLSACVCVRACERACVHVCVCMHTCVLSVYMCGSVNKYAIILLISYYHKYKTKFLIHILINISAVTILQEVVLKDCFLGYFKSVNYCICYIVW